MISNEIESDLYQLKSVFTTAEAKAKGFSPYLLTQLASQGLIQKVGLGKSGVGLWANMNYSYDRRLLIQLQYPQAILSGQSALVWWNLIDQQDTHINITVPQGYRVNKYEKDSDVSIRHVSPRLYPIGRTQVSLPEDDSPLNIYEPERAIIDAWRFTDEVTSWDRNESVSRYFQSDFCNPLKFRHYLNQFPGLKALQTLVEVLSN